MNNSRARLLQLLACLLVADAKRGEDGRTKILDIFVEDFHLPTFDCLPDFFNCDLSANLLLRLLDRVNQEPHLALALARINVLIDTHLF